MRLRALTGLEYGKLTAERDELQKQIAYFNEVLRSEPLQMKIIKDELLEMKEKYSDERRSEIVYASEEFNPEDFYADDDMVITISHMGYIKRTPLAEYRTQNRGGVGAKGSATRDEDFIEHIYVATMHNTMLFFTEKGRCYWLKVYEIPEARSSKGRAIQNVIQIEPDDKVRAYINVKRLDDEEYVNNNYIIMCTKDGTIKKTRSEAYSRPRQNGVNAIVIREGDQLIEAKLTSGNAEVMIAAREGKAIRFNERTVRPIGRVGAGVRGISLEEGDEAVGMICVEPDSGQDVLVLSENGYGKRTDLDEYRITNRGGKGVKTINTEDATFWLGDAWQPGAKAETDIAENSRSETGDQGCRRINRGKTAYTKRFGFSLRRGSSAVRASWICLDADIAILKATQGWINRGERRVLQLHESCPSTWTPHIRGSTT